MCPVASANLRAAAPDAATKILASTKTAFKVKGEGQMSPKTTIRIPVKLRHFEFLLGQIGIQKSVTLGH